jgi:type III restriction enzyme
MKLKDYQKASLATLRAFLAEARITGPKAAYEKLTQAPELAARLKGYAAGYKPLKGLPEVPYVCLRLPTGGGKTILAAHAITTAKDTWLEKDYPLVLWLVPTNTIRVQTAEALNNPRHPYGQVLNDAFEGRVRVFDIGKFTQITPQDLRSNLCVVVGTIQTLRQSKTDKYQVYKHQEMLEPHFSKVPNSAAGLQKYTAEDEARDKAAGKPSRPAVGQVLFSFANLLHWHNPMVIMDEAHKSGSDLSNMVYERINPSVLVEFTATPKGFNNILHSVTAQELKTEDMIKLPVVLDEADTWQSAVNSAILKRAELQEAADLDREAYIRPIVLFQAQKKNEEVTVEVLKNHLIENENIDPNKIAVATGAQRELDGIDLFKPDCKIEYVITIEALKEGWDCSFAYVFCSMANIKSSTDAEQLLGRVLRMPYATRRKNPILNKSYARLVSKRFSEAAQTLRDKLVDMGFEESEAEANIEAEQRELGEGLFGRQPRPKPNMVIELDMDAAEAKAISSAAPRKITVTPNAGGKTSLKIEGILKPAEKEQLYAQTPARLHGELKEKITAYEAAHAHEVAPAQRGEVFTVPRLVTWVQGEMVFAETDLLMEYHDWSLRDHPARLAPDEFSIIETTNTFEIDLDGNRLLLSAGVSSAQMSMDVDVQDWTPNSLVMWLDKKLRDPHIGQAEMLGWLSDMVKYLTQTRDIPLAQLMRCKFVLARKLSDKLKEIRQAEKDGVYQLNLFSPEARVEVSYEKGFRFFDEMYADVPKYRGTKFAFKNHFAGPDEIPAFDGAAGGEEEQCALAMDSLSEIEYWTRNVAKHRHSFYLPTPTGRFFPDFVAKLKDGRILVVEYKGQQHAGEQETKDTRQKSLIGEQWAENSNGQGVFVLATMERKDLSEIRQAIATAISG